MNKGPILFLLTLVIHSTLAIECYVCRSEEPMGGKKKIPEVPGKVAENTSFTFYREPTTEPTTPIPIKNVTTTPCSFKDRKNDDLLQECPFISITETACFKYVLDGEFYTDPSDTKEFHQRKVIEHGCFSRKDSRMTKAVLEQCVDVELGKDETVQEKKPKICVCGDKDACNTGGRKHGGSRSRNGLLLLTLLSYTLLSITLPALI